MLQALFGALVPALLGALFLGLGIVMRRRRLRPNHLVGIRTGRTLRSDEDWYLTHEAAAPWFIAAGTASLVAWIFSGVVQVTANPPPGFLAAVWIIVFWATIALVIIGSIVGLRASARKR